MVAIYDSDPGYLFHEPDTYIALDVSLPDFEYPGKTIITLLIQNHHL
ncbi:MAG: hypothetical protein LUQ50_12295 [Methanospirillum sp.]|nr:hypothetical protein [Methanospirillum sp.]MDD1729837.1 hypothetical protein [Methanospirillum sp.]